MTTSLPNDISRIDSLMLCICCRLTPQDFPVLKAHLRSGFVINFCSQIVWLQSNFSLEISGFMCATASKIEEERNKDAVINVIERR